MSPSRSNSRPLARLLEYRIVRRCLTIPTVIIVGIVLTLLSPVLLIVAAIWDLIRAPGIWPRVRLLALIVGALIIEMCGIVMALFKWVVTGFGLLGSPEWRWHQHRSLMGRYTDSLLRVISFSLGTRIEWGDNADLGGGHVVVLARHTSFFDALIPATLLARRHQLLPHHVLTKGLTYAPCIDLFGHRFPNVFVRRTPGQGSTELASIQELGTHVDERSASLIFPEGTFRTPERQERVLRRLSQRHPEQAERAAKLDHVLPPRAAGTHALLRGSPTADVVICTNTGFEPFGSLRSIVSRPRAARPILIESWRIDRQTIPDDYDEFADWLLTQYETINAWVVSHNEIIDARVGDPRRR